MTPDRDTPPPCQHAPCLGHFAATGDDRCILARLQRRTGSGAWITPVLGDPLRSLAIGALLLVLAAGVLTAIARHIGGA